VSCCISFCKGGATAEEGIAAVLEWKYKEPEFTTLPIAANINNNTAGVFTLLAHQYMLEFAQLSCSIFSFPKSRKEEYSLSIKSSPSSLFMCCFIVVS